MIHKFDRGNCLDEWAGFLKIPCTTTTRVQEGDCLLTNSYEDAKEFINGHI